MEAETLAANCISKLEEENSKKEDFNINDGKQYCPVDLSVALKIEGAKQINYIKKDKKIEIAIHPVNSTMVENDSKKSVMEAKQNGKNISFSVLDILNPHKFTGKIKSSIPENTDFSSLVEDDGMYFFIFQL